MKKNSIIEYIEKAEVLLTIQNYIRGIQMLDTGSDEGIPQLYALMEMIDNIPVKKMITS